MSDIALSAAQTVAKPILSGARTLRVIQTVSIFIIALVAISPLFLLVIASLKDDRFQILADMGSFRAFWVSDPTLNNFAEVGHLSGELAFGRYLLNSLIILVTTVCSGLIVNSMQARRMAKVSISTISASIAS